ncbi:MAG: hypothetical protein U5L10_02220 [Candidatus Moranbacteria bacterium]|nr:hypothetical protein [Candidatus Moranbacteria bacterium]
MQYSIVNYKTVKENSDFRIDGEFYHPAILSRLNLLEGKNNEFLNNLVKFVVGPFGSTVTVDKYVDESDYRYIRNKDINDFVISDDEPALIPEKVYSPLKHFHIQKDDLLLTVVGTLGKVAIAQEKDSKSIFSCKSTLLRSQKLNPYYLLTYLNSPTGQIFSLRGKRGAIQEGLNLTDLKDIKVFVPSSDFQNLIEILIKKSFDSANQSKSLYSQAEQLLLSELELTSWKPKHELSFIKNYSDTQEAGRFDAEYFQPKYEEIIEAARKYKGGFDELGNLVKIKDKNFTPKDDEQYKYIELANISSNGEINGYTKNLGKELPSRARRKVERDDLIISSIEGSLDSIALISDDLQNALCSTGFFVIQSKNINSETLLILLKTKVGQLQLTRGCKGTILTAISKDELSKIVLPKIDSKIQEEIKKKITEMYKTKKLSKSLLEIAKQGVEMAIEKDEQSSEDWIKEELQKLNVKL